MEITPASGDENHCKRKAENKLRRWKKDWCDEIDEHCRQPAIVAAVMRMVAGE